MGDNRLSLSTPRMVSTHLFLECLLGRPEGNLFHTVAETVKSVGTTLILGVAQGSPALLVTDLLLSRVKKQGTVTALPGASTFLDITDS